VQCDSGDCNDLPSLVGPSSTKEEPTEDDCAGGCCSTKPVSGATGNLMADSYNDGCTDDCSQKPVSVATEDSKADNCDDGCCETTNEGPNKDCKDDCCGSLKPEKAQESKGEM
jgi:hypothetical protein